MRFPQPAIRRAAAGLCACAALLGSQAARALTIDNYSAAANDRFATNNPSAFIANGFNLSGVSRASNNAWVTMIAPNVFVSCYHYTPAAGDSVPFYATNNSAGPSVTRTVSGARQRIGTTDIFLGTLDRPLPEGYASYAHATETVTNSTAWTDTYRNSVLYHFGISPGSYSGALDIAVGHNVPDRWVGSHTISPSTTWAFATTYDTNGAANYQTHETMVVSDSGAPIFADTGSNTFRLVGITWGKGTWAVGGTNYPISIFTYLGNYTNEIAGFLATNSAPYLPNTPADFTAGRVTPSIVSLGWQDLSAVETGYMIERSPDGSAWSSLTNLAANSTNYIDTGAPGTDVHYRLRADNGATAGDWVSVALITPVPPAAPSNLAAAGTTASSVSLTWQDNSNNETQFVIERSATGLLGSYTALATNAANATSYTDTGLAAGTRYFYRLRSTNAVGSSAWGGPIAATTESTQSLIAGYLSGWYRGRTTSTPASTLTVDGTDLVHFTGGSSGNAQYAQLWRYFDALTLADGESLRLEATFAWDAATTIPNDTHVLRFGFFNSNGTKQLADIGGDNNGNHYDDYGYGVMLGSGTNLTSRYTEDAPTETTKAAMRDGWVVLGADSGSAAIADTGDHTLVFEIKRQGSSLLINAWVDGVLLDGGRVVATPSTFSYDMFQITNRWGNVTWRIRSLTVVKSAPAAASLTPLESWRLPIFGTVGSEDIAADDADPDADGIPNLIEFSLGGAPLASGDEARLPALGDDAGHLTLSFTPQETAGLRFIIESSPDLSAWTAQADITAALTKGQSFTHTDPADMASTPRSFLRLRVQTE